MNSLALVIVGGSVMLGVMVALMVWTKSRQSADGRAVEQGRQALDSMVLLQQQVQQLRDGVQSSLDTTVQRMQDQMQIMHAQVATTLNQQVATMQQTGQGLNQRLDNAAQVIGAVQRELGKVAERVQAVGELKDLLRAPKLRGGFGEIFLHDLLSQILPREHVTMQHHFADGKIVDAVARIGEKMVPIDSKFPLENFQKGFGASEEEEIGKTARRQFLLDVRKHVDAVAGYIRPDEGTYDFALLYIPAENIYYEVAVKGDSAREERSLLSYALGKRVIPVSPNTLYAYLLTISLGLRGLQVEAQAQEILGQLGRVQQEFGRLNEEFGLIGKHLTNAQSAYDKVGKRMIVLDSRLEKFAVPDAAPPQLVAVDR